MALPSVLSSLVDKFSHGKKPLTENFLALKLGDNAVAATFWQIIDGKVEIGEVSLVPRTSTDEKHLLQIVDEAISKVSAGIKPEPQKIIFGVSEDWITEGKLHHEKLIELRKLCRQLDLSPMGFVAMNEAVENLLRVAEGVPPTALLVGVDKEKIFVTLLRAGKNMGTYVESMSEDLAASLEKAIRKFAGTDYLPSRIIVYDGRTDLEAVKQKIVAYPWTQRLPFLHFPKVEILETMGAVKAIAIAGGTQLGGRLDLAEVDWVKENESEAPTPIVAVEDEKAQQETTEEPVIHVHDEPIVDPGQFEEKVTTDQEEISPELEAVNPQELGFVTEEMEPTIQDLPDGRTRHHFAQNPVSKLNLANSFRSFFSKISSLKFIKRESGHLDGEQKKPLLPLIGVAVALLLVVILSVVGLYFLPKATVTVYVDQKQFNQTLDLVVSPSKDSTSSATLVGKTIEVNLSTTKKGVASGKKLVGTKAKGSITIYNSASARTFPAGTVVTTNNLRFATDSDIDLASSSGLATPSTATISVTALDIGENYNITTGSLFTISNLPSTSYQGKNTAAFSGGSSHQATVVSKDDQTRLMASASAELESRAKEELKGKLATGETLLDKAITSKQDKKKFSREIDTEADSLTLDLSMIFTGLVFDENDAKSAFKNSVMGNIPSGYDLPLDKVASNLAKVNVRKDGAYVLTMDFHGNAQPLIDTFDLVKRISGKNLKQVEQIVKNINGVNKFDVVLMPKFLEKFQMLPMRTDKIIIEVVTL